MLVSEEARKRVQDLKYGSNKPDPGDAARISKLEAKIAVATEEPEELQERSNWVPKFLSSIFSEVNECHFTTAIGFRYQFARGQP
ncbi:hypothetical protein PHLCEN_2v11853 [Hermanssonia centrifuga]|uniref:Uncharacterized protein n=1 Tax=Hermanssonia centrifuga TaxID=98765 RepID=A0A2R6NIY4_9APHY|nr:hypothetical protein PHLCEN_2v11853 [Hermanssonia centrifuga]